MVLTEQSKKTAAFLKKKCQRIWSLLGPQHTVFVSAVLESVNKVPSMFFLFVEIAVACGHFSAALHLCVEPGEDPDKQAFSK